MARRPWSISASKLFVASDQCLFGADDTTRGFTSRNGIETQLGTRMGIRNRHYSWNADASRIAEQWKLDAAAGAIPMISLGGQGYTEALVEEIAAGKHDDYWTSLFTALEPLHRGLFRPWMEMNGKHNAYQANITNFISMWHHVHALYLKVMPARQLAWIWCPQAFDPKQVWPAYYPGDQCVDWVGLDLYRDVFDSAQPWLEYAVKHKKPFCIAESGFEQDVVVKSADGSTYDKDGSKTGRSLILDTLRKVKAHPNCVAYLVWNNIGPAGHDFIDTSSFSLEQYRQWTKDGYFAFGP